MLLFKLHWEAFKTEENPDRILSKQPSFCFLLQPPCAVNETEKSCAVTRCDCELETIPKCLTQRQQVKVTQPLFQQLLISPSCDFVST